MFICQPIMAKNYDEIAKILSSGLDNKIDIVEIRLDTLADFNVSKLSLISTKLKEANIRLILTLRTKKEGGAIDLDVSNYEKYIRQIIDKIDTDYIDIQRKACTNDSRVRMLADFAKQKGKKVIISEHNFAKTQTEDKIYKSFLHINYLGADISKIAQMAASEQDVYSMIDATRRAAKEVGGIIGISMGEVGVATRTDAEEIGSVIAYNVAQGSMAHLSKGTGQIDILSE
ncbi:MAG: type I 3-dehydroquinate dehydratase [Eubacteriales bacterium]|nr:type I 3-dehydroquinate dehydratase [Eubacteriales bacterium]MDY3333248.1 type I 3-dehydroquinate dehydratase [Gallibacter sp.]